MQLFKRLIPKHFKRDIKDKLGVPSLHRSLVHLKRLGFRPKLAVDVGAYHGEWTIEFLSVFPDSMVLMCEAQPDKARVLKGVCARYPMAQCQMAVLGAAEDQEVIFSEDETASHVVRAGQSQGTVRKTETLDAVLAKRKLPVPDLIKLDVQGYELEVLKGASNALAGARFCLLEVALIDYGHDNPLIFEVMRFMDERGFRPYDIAQMMRRPYDQALDQIDLLFVRKDDPLATEKRWS